jgi:hypothetical protein
MLIVHNDSPGDTKCPLILVTIASETARVYSELIAPNPVSQNLASQHSRSSAPLDFYPVNGALRDIELTN